MEITEEQSVTNPLLVLATLSLLAAPAAANEIDCATAEPANQTAMNALASKASAAKDKATRCAIGRDLLPLFDKQVAIAEKCQADDKGEINAVRLSVWRKKSNFKKDCGG